MMSTEYNALHAFGEAFGKVIGEKLDWDVLWRIHHASSNSCIQCGREYKGVKRGWLIRHYKQTGHWRAVAP